MDNEKTNVTLKATRELKAVAVNQIDPNTEAKQMTASRDAIFFLSNGVKFKVKEGSSYPVTDEILELDKQNKEPVFS